MKSKNMKIIPQKLVSNFILSTEIWACLIFYNLEIDPSHTEENNSDPEIIEIKREFPKETIDLTQDSPESKNISLNTLFSIQYISETHINHTLNSVSMNR